MATRSRLPKVSQYVKNVGKSVAFFTIEAVKSNAPEISDFIDTNDGVFKEVYSSVKNFRQTMRKVGKDIKESNIYTAVDVGLKNLIEDVKTGKLYNDRTVDMDDAILGMEDDDYNDNEDFSSSKNLSDSFNDAIGAAAISQNTAVAQGTNLMINTTKASTRLMMAGMTRMSAEISSSIGAVYTSVDKVNKFLNTTMISHMENSKRYYEESLKSMRETQMMIKELLEMQRNLYKEKETEYRSTHLDDSMRSSGAPELRGYFKNVKKNFNDFLDYTTGGLTSMMSGMDIGGGNPYLAYAAAPMKFIMEPLFKSIIPKNFQKAVKSFDKTITSLFSKFISEMNSARDKDDGSLLSMLGSIFGIKIDKKESIDNSSYKKGAVPFDGITRKAIIETIPGYLARIEAALTGNGERHYDYKTGTFKSARRIEVEFDDIKRRAIIDGSGGIRDDLRPFISKMEAVNKREAAEMDKSVLRVMAKIYEDGGNFRPDRGKGRDIDDMVEAWKYYGARNKKEFETILNHISKDTLRSLAKKNMNARQEYTRTLKELQESGSVFSTLFNGQYDSTGVGKGKRANPSQFNGGSGLLALSQDREGRNVFWYLKEILNSIGRVRNKRKNKEEYTVYYKNNRREHSSTSSNNNSSESSESSGEDPDPGLFDDVEDSIREENKEAYIKAANRKKLGDRVAQIFVNSRVGRFLGNLADKFGGFIAKPFDYMTKLLNKADDSMIKMMFGENEYYDDNGNRIDNVFDIIVYNIKKTFKKMTDWMKEKLFNPIKKILDPLFDKYIKPITNEIKNKFKSGKERVKTAVSNTFGKGLDYISEKLRRGHVVDEDDINDAKNAETSAAGRIVTKRGLTMISPGEIIIPASFDKKEQKKMLALEKRDKRRIVDAIEFNAEGKYKDGIDKMKKTFGKIYEENKGKISKVGASGVIGAGAGLLTGINPVLGAVAGSALSIIENSETLKSFLFGKDGKNGLVPENIYKFFKKALPDMGDFGIAGGLVGLLTPLGPLGGAAVGAGIGMLKNSESFKNFIFGEDGLIGDNGVISKETYEKAKGFLKKNIPSMAIGAVGGAVLGGPFGLLGNAVLGAGAGLLSSTDEFHKFVFGDAKDPRKNTLVGAINRGILEPAKEKVKAFFEEFNDFIKNTIYKPLKMFGEEFKQSIKNTISSIGNKVKDSLDNIFEKTIGIPLSDFLQEKIFKPATKLIFGILKAPLKIGKAVISAPFKALGGISNSMRMGKIQRGKAYHMSAQERLDFRKNHKVRDFFGTVTGRDKMYEQDQMFARMDLEQLEKIRSNALIGIESESKLQRRVGKAREDTGLEISDYFNNTKGEDGKYLYNSVKYNDVKNKIAKIAATGDWEATEAAIDKLNGLTDKQKADLKERIRDKVGATKTAVADLNNARNKNKNTDDEVSNILGRKFKGRKDRRQIYDYAQAELKARNKKASNGSTETGLAVAEEDKSQETKAIDVMTNVLSDLYNDKSNQIIEKLSSANDYLRKLVGEDTLVSDEGTTDSTSPGKKKRRGRKKKNKSTSTAASTGTDIVVYSDPDSKENVERRNELQEDENREIDHLLEAKQTTSVLTTIKNYIVGAGNEKDKKSKKSGIFGILSNLGSGVSKLLGFLGVGAKVALGVSLFGHATEWFKTSIWPSIKTTLFGKSDSDKDGLIGKLKVLFLGENGNTGILGKAGTWLTEKFNNIKKWYEEKGGLGGIIVNDVLPKMIDGWALAMDNVVTPAVAILVKHLPSMLLSLAKGIINGLKIAVWNKEIKRETSETFDSSEALAEMQADKDARYSNFSASIGNLKNSAGSVANTAASSAAFTAAKAKSLDYSKLLDSDYLEEDETYDANGNKQNKNSNEIRYKKGFLGSKQSTNEIPYDEDGNIALDSYDTWNTTDSVLSKYAKTAGQALLRSTAGMKSGIGNLLKKASAKGIGKGWFKAATAGGGVLSKLAGSGINAAQAIGSTINKSTNAASAYKSFAKTVSDMSAAIPGAGSYDDILAKATKDGIGKTASDLFKNTSDEVANKAIVDAGNSSLKTIKNLTNVTDDVVKNSADNVAKKAVETTTKKGIVKTATEAVKNTADDAAKGLGAKISAWLTKVLSNSKISGFLLKACTPGTTMKVLGEAVEKMAKKLGDSIVGKVTGKALTKVAGALANASPLGIAILVIDFLYGYNNADTILGVAKGDTYKVNFGQKCLCGILNLINNKLTLGLVPNDLIVDIIVDYLFPIFGLDATSLQEARNRADDIMDQWNKEHPDETYTNLEDFNNKDKLITKAGKAIKGAASKAWDGIKSGASKAWEGTKNVVSKVKEMGSAALSTAKESFSAFTSGGWKTMLKNFTTAIGTLISNAWKGEDEEIKMESTGNELLDKITSGLFGVAKVYTTIPRLLVSLVGKIKRGVDTVIEGFKTVGTSLSGAFKKLLTKSWDGDFKGVILAQPDPSGKSEVADTISSVIFNVAKTSMTPIVLLTTTIGAIKNGIVSMIDKWKTAQNNKKADDEKIDKAYDGELSLFSEEYWKNADHSKEGLPGSITNLQTLTEKFINAPFILIKSIISRVGETFEDMKNWFGNTAGGIWSWITGFFSGDDKEEATKKIEEQSAANKKNNGKGRRYYGSGHAYQSDSLISNMRYGDSTIGKSGCAPVAAANLINHMNSSNSMTVQEAARYAEKNNLTVPGGGTNIKYFKSFLNSHGISTKNTSNHDDILDALRKGNQVVMLGKDGNNNPGAPFGTTPHFVTATGIDPYGNIIVEDPDLPQGSVTYNKNKLMGSMVTSIIAKDSMPKRVTHGLARTDDISTIRDNMGNVFSGNMGYTAALTKLNNKEPLNITNSTANKSDEDETSVSTLIEDLLNLGKAAVKKLFGGSIYSALYSDEDGNSSGTGLLSKYNSSGGTFTDEELNDLVAYKTTSAALKGNTNAEKIWNYLISKGYTKHGAAGLMGNLYAESGYLPNNVQNSYESKVGSDADYTSKVDNGSYSANQFAHDSAGYGLAQWTYWSRKKKLYDYIKARGDGSSIGDLAPQLDYLDYELKGYKGLYELLHNTDNYKTASNEVLDNYEKPAERHYDTRQAYSKSVYDTFSESKRTSVNYGSATRSLNAYRSGVGYGRATTSTASTSNAVDYSTFLQTIVTILMTIADNTSVLNKILQVLSEQFGIDIDTLKVKEANSTSKAKTEAALKELVNKSAKESSSDTSKLLNNKGTDYLLAVMKAIAQD